MLPNVRRHPWVLDLGEWLCSGQDCKKQPSASPAIRAPRCRCQHGDADCSLGAADRPTIRKPRRCRAAASGADRVCTGEWILWRQADRPMESGDAGTERRPRRGGGGGRAAFGADEPRTLDGRVRLALAYREEERDEEAVAEFERACSVGTGPRSKM